MTSTRLLDSTNTTAWPDLQKPLQNHEIRLDKPPKKKKKKKKKKKLYSTQELSCLFTKGNSVLGFADKQRPFGAANLWASIELSLFWRASIPPVSKQSSLIGKEVPLHVPGTTRAFEKKVLKTPLKLRLHGHPGGINAYSTQRKHHRKRYTNCSFFQRQMSLNSLYKETTTFETKWKSATLLAHFLSVVHVTLLRAFKPTTLVASAQSTSIPVDCTMRGP